MLRSFVAAGGREHRASNLYAVRRPPSAARFLDQRIRQAYDDFAQPGRLAAELSLLPLLSVIAVRRPTALGLVAGAVIAVAETGRRRHGGAQVFPRTAALWAPFWLLERSCFVWLAAVERMRGGVRYRGQRLREAATPTRPRPPLETLTEPPMAGTGRPSADNAGTSSGTRPQMEEAS